MGHVRMSYTLTPTATKLCAPNLPLPFQEEAHRIPELGHVPHQHSFNLSLVELADLV